MIGTEAIFYVFQTGNCGKALIYGVKFIIILNRKRVEMELVEKIGFLRFLLGWFELGLISTKKYTKDENIPFKIGWDIFCVVGFFWVTCWWLLHELFIRVCLCFHNCATRIFNNQYWSWLPIYFSVSLRFWNLMISFLRVDFINHRNWRLNLVLWMF